MTNYQLLDSGDQEKLERFGPFTLIRPCSQALWQKRLPKLWKEAHAKFSREGEMQWSGKRLPKEWDVELFGLKVKIQPTDFGHLGLFPEHQSMWSWVQKKCSETKLLNLFAYSGVLSLVASKAGALVTHVDAASGMVEWAKENASLNKVENVRWIVDDARRYMERQERRGEKYQGIILDPPSFGRGKKGEVFKIERDLHGLLAQCKRLLDPKGGYIGVSCHTPGITPKVLEHLLEEVMQRPCESGEMLLPSEKSFSLPMGAYARCSYAD